MPEMKNPKHPSPHMINIPWWVYQHVWFVSSAFCRAVTSMASEPGVHSARGAAATEFIQKQMSVRVHEETAQALWPPRQLCHPKVLSRDQGAEKVPASAKFLKGLEQQHWPLRHHPLSLHPSVLCHLPHPAQEKCGIALLLSPSVAISAALLWRDVWNSNLCQHWGHEAVEMHPLGTRV